MENVTNSFDGIKICDKLRADLKTINYNPDLHKMLKNIEKMVTEISKYEVVSRQTHNKNLLQDPLKKLNDSVKHLDKLILMAKLMD